VKKCAVIFLLWLSNTWLLASTTPNVTVTPFHTNLKDINHYSEGFVDIFSTGILINIFRMDTGITGHHAGNNGCIVRRFSFDDGLTWTNPVVIYSDSLDDRNISGGIIEGERVVVFFRRYESVYSNHVDFNMIFSDDGGYTWSERQEVNTNGISSYSQKIFQIHGRGYYTSFYNINYFELRYSVDGLNWDSVVAEWDYRLTMDFKTSESSFVYLNNGVIYGLIRNENKLLGNNFYYTISYDAGITWTTLEQTNIGNGFWCPSPSMYYDMENQVLWIVTADRRGLFLPYHFHQDSQIWIYGTYVFDIYNNPSQHNLIESRLRPFPNFYQTYGYHSMVRLPNGNIYVIGTESTKRIENFLEWAWFYDFYINYNSPVSSPLTTQHRMFEVTSIGPNPFINDLYVVYTGEEEIPSEMIIVIFDAKGMVVFEKKIETCSASEIPVFDKGYILPAGLYTAQIQYRDNKYVRKLVKI